MLANPAWLKDRMWFILIYVLISSTFPPDNAHRLLRRGFYDALPRLILPNVLLVSNNCFNLALAYPPVSQCPPCHMDPAWRAFCLHSQRCFQYLRQQLKFLFKKLLLVSNGCFSLKWLERNSPADTGLSSTGTGSSSTGIGLAVPAPGRAVPVTAGFLLPNLCLSRHPLRLRAHISRSTRNQVDHSFAHCGFIQVVSGPPCCQRLAGFFCPFRSVGAAAAPKNTILLLSRVRIAWNVNLEEPGRGLLQYRRRSRPTFLFAKIRHFGNGGLRLNK